jgi:bifunctional non-homologous end joining protein LigD
MHHEFAGIGITHPDRLLFPAAGHTKLDLVRYYDAVSSWILPHLRGRPLTLKQCAPDADHCRYLRHSGERAPAEVRVIDIREKTKVGDYMIVDDERGLIALAQRNIVEFHTWNCTADRLEYPDRIVFDLDPGPRVPWARLVAAARIVRDALAAVKLQSWLKTTGGKGLHVVVPIRPEHEWSGCLAFAKALAGEIEQHDPSVFTTRYRKTGREDLILLDYLRNNRTNTSVAACSARARPTATVSVPLDWDDLTPRFRPERWTIKTLPRRLKTVGDPWKGYFKAKQRLTARARSVP